MLYKWYSIETYMHTIQRTKVLYLITKSNFGGAQRYVFDLATHLPHDRYSVAVACGGTGTKGAPLGTLVKKLAQANIRTIPVASFMRDMSLIHDMRAIIELWKLVRAERPDVLHVTSSKAGGLGAFIGRLAGVPHVIFTSHGLAFDETWRPRWQRALIWVATWWTMLFAHTTIQITRDTYERAARMPFMKQRIRLIHNGIVCPMYRSRDEARNILATMETKGGAESRDSFWIGTIAEFTANKNLSVLLDTLASLHKNRFDVHLWLIGDGEERKALDARIRELDLMSYVHMPGYVPDAATLLKAFDIFVLPSRKEGLPYVLLEAGYARLPVVVSNIPGAQDIVSNAQTGLLVSPTTDAFMKALTTLLRNTNRAQKYGTALKAHVEDTFSLAHMVSTTTALYASSNPSTS